ncbi:hypothetical protein [Polluticoccus soli]|uniref:hypothetical protein n=1 Tax=Polluticoccus soli TaxID=3034150 RepID=UPI0023E2D177|nr:hypothetical protein [Flavipsychrobacter sp. JY13-12]
MDRTIHMSERKKNVLGVLSFIPLLTFLTFVGYFIYLCQPLIKANTLFIDHESLATIMSNHYPTLLVLSMLAFFTGIIMLIYYLVHITRLTSMNSGEKLAWMVFMVTFVGISFPIFWFSEIRHEPEHLPIYPDIA